MSQSPEPDVASSSPSDEPRRRWRPLRALLRIVVLVLLVAGVLAGLAMMFTVQGREIALALSETIRWRQLEQADHAAAAAMKKAGAICISSPEDGCILTVSFLNRPLNDEIVGNLASLFRVETINLSNSNLKDDHLRQLAGLRHLTCLVISGNDVTDAGLAHVAQIRSLENFQAVRTRISDASAGRLAGLRDLRILDLSETRVTDASVPVLAGLPELKHLILLKDKVTDDGIASLEKSPALGRLSILGVPGVTAKGIERLKKAKPNLAVD
jgi:hypothetical protein